MAAILVSISSFAQENEIVSKEYRPTHKTILRGKSDVTYFGIEQIRAQTLPYVLCEQGVACDNRTVKTLIGQKPKETVSSGDIHTVYFQFGSSTLGQIEKDFLRDVFVQVKGDTTVKLRGWTDPVGGEVSKKNIALAKARVNAVAQELVKNNVKGFNLTMDMDFSPPCCVKQGTAKSPDSVRKHMRLVSIEFIPVKTSQE